MVAAAQGAKKTNPSLAFLGAEMVPLADASSEAMNIQLG